jgi:hypothetical protein
MPYLDQSKISLPKDETNYNTWADYFELFCLLHPDRNLSVEALKDRLIDENGGDVNRALSQIIGVSRRIDMPAIDMIADDEIDNDVNDPETEQEIRTCIIKVIQYMHRRLIVIPDYYPFSINENNQLFAVETTDLTDNHKLYIILLVSSLIRVIHRANGFAYRITHRFEELCGPPFRRLLPDGAQTRFFGSGGYIAEAERGVTIDGNFFNKVTEIARLLNLETTRLFTQNNAGIYNNGDGGLDWLGYFSFDDGLSTTPTYFAQCACGNDWEDKQFDAHMDKWRNYITWLNDYHRIHFIPKSFRNELNEWLDGTAIFNCTLIDRFRLIQLITLSGDINQIVNIYSDILDEIDNTSIVFG